MRIFHQSKGSSKENVLLLLFLWYWNYSQTFLLPKRQNIYFRVFSAEVYNKTLYIYCVKNVRIWSYFGYFSHFLRTRITPNRFINRWIYAETTYIIDLLSSLNNAWSWMTTEPNSFQHEELRQIIGLPLTGGPFKVLNLSFKDRISASICFYSLFFLSLSPHRE